MPGPTRAEDRPPPPWGSFPLMEILVLIALVLFVWGVISKRWAIVALGLAIGSLGGLELSIREHFKGFRSHTTLLASAVAFAALAATFFASGGMRYVALPVAAAVFVVSFWALRQAFSRRSGGVGFRR